ncbi:hypothetical protein BDN71DRAFT_604761 [Pleurotus eryngii]|uniref:Uncharacterized protein n=1 Tax=Pleurotus eryngii TaxID=5323 RepID=A0A9P6A1Y6_PLEER|nr:hypothetical protein BDN71DRAFT_604761 [Pleurotus eryngii]
MRFGTYGYRRRNDALAKFMFFWIRYYTIFLLVFDVARTHIFTLPGVTSDIVCLAINPTTRIIGAISLWSVEIIMQLRIYALFRSNKKPQSKGYCF